MQVKNKIIVVTGAASGIGQALARRFAAEGARSVVSVDLNAEGAAATAAEVGGLSLTANVSMEADIENVIETTEQDVGPIDLFCSNAGIGMGMDLGKHTNDHMVSFYMKSPSGFEVEYGWGARVIDDATWNVVHHTSGSIWGHTRPGG